MQFNPYSNFFSIFDNISMSQALPFQAVVPLRLVGVNSKVPFCSIISEGKIIYSCGSNILLQNTKTNQQKIIYTHSLAGSITLITHHVTLYNEHLLAIVVNDLQLLMHAVVIVPLNAAIFSHEDRKDPQTTHYLKHIEEYQQIESITFFEEGTLFGIVSKYKHITNFSLLRTSNSDLLFQQSYTRTGIMMAAASLSKQSCISLLLQQEKEGVRLCLLAADQLSRRYFYTLALQQNEEILQYSYENSQQDGLYLIALTSQGYIVIYKVNDYEAAPTARIDVKIKLEKSNSLPAFAGNLMPLQMQSAGNKIIVSYEDSKMLSLLQFSIFNPNNCKIIPLKQTLQKYTNIKATYSIRMSKDGCTLAALFLISNQPFPSRSGSPYDTARTIAIPHSLQSEGGGTQVIISSPGSERNIIVQPGKEYIALQIDLLAILMDHNEKRSFVEQTMSVCSGHAPVCKVEYCPHSNTLFMLLFNRSLKYYDLTPNFGLRGKLDYHAKNFQLWVSEFQQQPIGVAAHPSNFTLLLLYEDIIKFHHYNCKTLLPAFVVTSFKHCRFACYSPLGDKIVLAASGKLVVLDSYTYRTVRVVALNLAPQAALTLSTSKCPTARQKSVNSLFFLNNEEIMLLSGHNTLSIVLNLQKTAHFGLFEGDSDGEQAVVYDKVNNLAVVAQNGMILVLSKGSNTNNKCTLVSKFQISATALLQASELGVMFIGTEDGSLIMVEWPHYQQQDLYLHGSNRVNLFHQSIVAIKATPNMRFLYAVSQRGSLCICQLQVGQGDSIPLLYKNRLLSMAEIPLRQLHCWLISRGEQEWKQRKIIKLRGEEADNANHHVHLDKDQVNPQDQLMFIKKAELQKQYTKQIKAYEEELGLQRVLQSISLQKDEVKIIKKQQERERQELQQSKTEQLNKIFAERTSLEKQLSSLKITIVLQKQQLKQRLAKQFQYLVQDLKTQEKLIEQSNVQIHSQQTQKFRQMQLQDGQAEQRKQQVVELTLGEFSSERQRLVEVGQRVLSKNRNTNIAIHSLQDKMGELGIEKAKVQFDMFKVAQQQQQLLAVQKQLETTLVQQNVIYDRLMKQTRKMQVKLILERRLANKNQYTLDQVVDQIAMLEEHKNQLDANYHQINSEFVELKVQHQVTTNSLNDLNSQINSLRNVKKQKNYQQCLTKNRCAHALRTLARQLQVDQSQTIGRLKATLWDKQEWIQQNELGRQFETQVAVNDKMFNDVAKWREVKDCYMVGFRRNFRKLNEENIKLTYQYNDLQKVSQEYRTYLNYLVQNIRNAQRHQQVEAPPKCNLVNRKPHPSFIVHSRPEKPGKAMIRKKAVCVSLHQQTGKFITEA